MSKITADSYLLLRLETKVDKNYAKELPNPFHIKHKETKVMIQELIAIVRFPIDTLHRAKRRNTKTKNPAQVAKNQILLIQAKKQNSRTLFKV